jgi:uncharacterized protein Usg
MTDHSFQCQIEGFSLTTAEILYRIPDHPRLLQSYIWQAGPPISTARSIVSGSRIGG